MYSHRLAPQTGQSVSDGGGGGGGNAPRDALPAVRVEIHAYTASFRVPGMMGYQVTAPVPPPATIYGLLAAAAGREVTPEETWIAYRFEYDALASDLEKIIIYEKSGPKWEKKLYAPKTNVITRQFLTGARLTMYLEPGEAADALRRPRYPLLLGRSQDVAYVAAHAPASLEPIGSGEAAGILLPFPTRDPRLRSRVMAFSTFFPLGPSRLPRAVKPFHVLDSRGSGSSGRPGQEVAVPGLLYRDNAAAENRVVPRFTAKELSP